MLYVIAIWSFAWPVYRAFLNVEIQPNEGWNAYFADAAMGKMPLYPSTDQLITNNYPPLSFYIVSSWAVYRRSGVSWQIVVPGCRSCDRDGDRLER